MAVSRCGRRWSIKMVVFHGGAAMVPMDGLVEPELAVVDRRRDADAERGAEEQLPNAISLLGHERRQA